MKPNEPASINMLSIEATASMGLAPGDSICLFKQADGSFTAQTGCYGDGKSIIVNPFAASVVLPGEQFIALVKPGFIQPGITHPDIVFLG